MGENIIKYLLKIKKYCLSKPTCENCEYRENHKGCKFRYKTPREWILSKRS